MTLLKGWSSQRTLVYGLIISIVWLFLSTSILFILPSFFNSLNNKVYDFKLSLFAEPKLNADIVHLDIDDQAIKKYGQWPWDRSLIAQIVDRLTELGAKVIVFDIMFTSKGRTEEGDRALFKSISESGRTVMAVGLIENDPSLLKMENWQDKKNVEAVADRGWQLEIPPSFNPVKVDHPRASCLPLLNVVESAKQLGHINATPDNDGVHRRIPLLIRFGERFVPSLSLAALASYLDSVPGDIRISTKNAIEIKHSRGLVRIPMDLKANLLINWRPAWDSFDHYTALDVLETPNDASRTKRYKDKIVIISVAWTGTTDIGASPVEGEVLLSSVHSSVLDTILRDRFIRAISPFPLLVIISASLLLTFAIFASKTSVSKAIVLCAVPSIVSVIFTISIFEWFSLEIPLIEAYFIFLPGAALCLIFRSISIEKDRLLIRDTFGRYLSDEVVTEILRSPGGISLSGEMRDITILVSDLRGFTPMTEALEPRVVLRIINGYLERMIGIIMKHEGTIDEFTGDGILVLFGAPRPLPDHTIRAVSCALEMQDAMFDLNSENAILGLPELRMGIGINTGPLIVGNIGSERRKKYGAIGSAINIAFRVEAQTVGGEILVTRAVCNRIDGPLKCGTARVVRLKGIADPVTLYPVIGVI